MATGEETRPAERDGFVTIEELSARVGMSTRNIGAHRSRGLLPPPVVRGRVGMYGGVHVARLHLIKTLQEFGFNLSAIAAVLKHGSTYSEFLGRLRAQMIEGTNTADWVELPPESVDTLREVAPGLLEELVAGGALRQSPEGGFVCHPTLFGSGAELANRGMSARAMTRVMREVMHCVERVAAVPAAELSAIAPVRDASEVDSRLDDFALPATQLYVTAFEIALPEVMRRELRAAVFGDEA